MGESAQVLVMPLEAARRAIATLDASESWANLSSKDVPVAITQYVQQALRTETLDDVRKSLGMTNPSDTRWRKIITAIRTGMRIDSAAIFLKWLDRNERLGLKLEKVLDQVLEGQKPFTKMTFEAVNALNNLQTNTVKMGKDLGVFTDGSEAGKGEQGVTIVVQTMVPTPAKDVIVEHQKRQAEKAAKLLEEFKPKEGEGS